MTSYLNQMHLIMFVPASEGTAAKTRVLIESSDGKREWGTVGVSENIMRSQLAGAGGLDGICAAEKMRHEFH